MIYSLFTLKIKIRAVITCFSVVAYCLAAGSLSGCAPVVVSNVSAFSDLGAQRGTLSIQAGEIVDGSSLEFAHYRGLLAEHLSRHGYAVTEPSATAPADVTAVLSYEVSEVNPTGSGRTAAYWRSDWHFLAPATSGLMLVESRGDSRRHYRRRVAVHLTQRVNQKRIYEVRGDSIGACDVMSVVFDEMLAALFADFPRANGSLQRVRVNGDVRCR